MSRFWKAPVLFQDQTIYVVGGGPSLTGVDLSGLASRRTITVNNAYQIVPRPDVVFYCDSRWWGWHKAEVQARGFPRIITTASASHMHRDPGSCRMNRAYTYGVEGGLGLSDQPDTLCGPDGGSQAINLAYLLGASRIVLLGFDMGFDAGRAHWHEDHPILTPESNYIERFLPTYPALIDALRQRGVEVLRVGPSRLDFIDEISLADAVRLNDRRRQIL
jgi:hypothetical protein